MARFGFQDADNYGGGKNSFFSLKDDKDTARIRFLYNDINDVQGVATHEIDVGGKKVEVECLRAYNEPIDNCPLCAAEYKITARLFVPVYDMDAKEVKLWTRGKTFFQKLSSLCARYNPLVATPFEVERVGKKGDTNTTYETYPMQTDNSILSDFPEINPEGIAFEQRTYDELVNYLETGSFGNEMPTRRSATQAQPTRPASQPTRETPAAPVRRRPNYNMEENF